MKQRQELTAHATITLPIEVYGSIAYLVNEQDTEVAWFGDITVLNPDPQDLHIRIEKVYLYPQEVSGAAVHEAVNGDGYDDWYAEQIIKANGQPVMQYYGHSHVNMGVNPSVTDVDYRKQNSEYGVFSIHNKRGEAHCEIWTREYIYENKDIEILVVGNQLHNTDLIKKKVYATTGAGYLSKYYQGGNAYSATDYPRSWKSDNYGAYDAYDSGYGYLPQSTTTAKDDASEWSREEKKLYLLELEEEAEVLREELRNETAGAGYLNKYYQGGTAYSTADYLLKHEEEIETLKEELHNDLVISN